MLKYQHYLGVNFMITPVKDTVAKCENALLDGGDTLTDLQAQRTVVKNKYSKE